eukprot:Nk52_evm12s554 gene=Nk52_evmTU12s554
MSTSKKQHSAYEAILATALYSSCSMAMIFSNKSVLSVYNFRYPMTLLTVQAVISVGCLYAMSFAKIIKMEAFQIDHAIRWAPCSVFFILMLYTSTEAMGRLSVPMVTIFKNLTNIYVTAGDYYLNGNPVTGMIIGSLFLMVFGSILAGMNDLEFNLSGYIWMIGNVIATGSYTLYIKKAKKDLALSEYGMGLYNNVIMVVLCFPIAVFTGDFSQAMEFPQLWDTGFLVMLFMSGAIGAGLGLSVFYIISVTSPTTFSIVGSLNKIPLSIFAIIFFGTPVDLKSGVTIFFGLLSGMSYSYAKIQMAKQNQAPTYQAVAMKDMKDGKSPV